MSSSAFAVFNRLEVVQLAGAALALCVDRIAHLDLCINASVVAVRFHCLRDQQDADGQKAEAADGGQHRIGVSTHHLLGR